MAPSLSFLSATSKVLVESGDFKNRVHSSNRNNYLDFVNSKRSSVIIVKNSVIRMAHGTSKIASPEFSDYSNDGQHNVKRGRPKASSIPLLQAEAARRNNPLRCLYCKRDFKRKKALNTHVRTHTREKPYVCTYPCCDHKFTQSSHLDAHIRIHTKEKPFYCPIEGCSSDFTHQSRVCKLHMLPVKRKETKYGIKDIEDFSMRPEDEQEWLIQYFQNKENKAANIRKRKEASDSDSAAEKEGTLVASGGQRNEQSEGDEIVIQETQKQKRKRDDIKENVDNRIQKIENSIHTSNALDTKNSSPVLNGEDLVRMISDPPSPDSSTLSSEVLSAATILFTMYKRKSQNKVIVAVASKESEKVF